MKENLLRLAWAIAIDHVQLSARLEAYVETKSAITTFIACIAHSSTPSMSKLPPETIAMIADELKDLVYIPIVQRALRAEKCIRNECRERDHFPNHELAFYAANSEWYGTKYEPEILWEDSRPKHDHIVENYLRKFTHTMTTKDKKTMSRFAKCKKVRPAILLERNRWTAN